MSTQPADWSAESEPLTYATLGRQVADALRRDILFGRLAPGTKIGQQQLCDRFGISRMPVRDAMRQLMHEGLIQPDGARHSIVARRGRRDIEDSFEIEGMLHGMAVRRVCEHLTPEQLATLERQHEEMHAASEDLDKFAELNWRFHRGLNRMADSPKLLVALGSLSLSIPRDYVVHLPEWISRADEEHGLILAAIKARHAKKAESLIKAHVTEAGRDLVQYLLDRGVPLE